MSCQSQKYWKLGISHVCKHSLKVEKSGKRSEVTKNLFNKGEHISP
jgi:hypothetical protein